MADELIIGKKNTLSLYGEYTVGEILKPLQNEIMLFKTYIAGITHLDDDEPVDELVTGDKLILKRQPENRFDENAILVLDQKERKLGYVPERDNIVFTRLMDAGKYLTAKVVDINDNDYFRKVGIEIYLIDF
jgi:hypothetical protein